MSDYMKFSFELSARSHGKRFDQALALQLEDHSRSTIQHWIKSGWVRINGKIANQKLRVAGGESIDINVPEQPTLDAPAQAIDIDPIYEDEAIIVVDKAAGLVVHPGAGNADATLMNGLLHRWPQLDQLPRAGIVHRLDKDTSGLMVVAKTEAARLFLIEQLSTHLVQRNYLALVNGRVISGGTVNAAIGRDSHDRRRMRVIEGGGKEAVSHYRVAERFRHYTLLNVSLQTGRTHQIRVHMKHIGFPLVGDSVYGGRFRRPADSSDDFVDSIKRFKRQALHAEELALTHPLTGAAMNWQSPVPDDYKLLLSACRQWDASQ